MNLFLLCIASILTKNCVLTNPPEDCDDESIRNESLRIDLKFQADGIVPCYLPVSPPDIIEVNFPTAAANLGNYISQIRTGQHPFFVYRRIKKGSLYTLIVINIDYPSRPAPVLSAGLLSLCVNIPGETFIKQTSGFSAAPYIAPSPTARSGQHRVVVALYLQKDTIDQYNRALLNYGAYPVGFDMEAFVSKYKLGNPVAGNYWVTSVTDACCSGVGSSCGGNSGGGNSCVGYSCGGYRCAGNSCGGNNYD